MAKRWAALLTGATLALASAEAATQSQTLEGVRDRGTVICGANGTRAGFSFVDSQGRWSGVDADVCRAIAAAVFGDPTKAQFVKVTSQTRFPALQTGEVDVLTANVSWTLARDAELGVDFVEPIFYDGQGFMVPKALEVSSVEDLEGATVCILPGTTSERVVADVFAAHGLSFTPVVIADQNELNNAFFGGRCDVQVQSSSGLSASRATVAANPGEWVILPELWGKDPMGPVVREGDAGWRDIVAWSVYALIAAEELGITSENVDQMLTSDNPEIRAFLGIDGNLGETLGLDNDWTQDVIRAVGNYGEIYDRAFGPETPLDLDRKLNALWTEGGLLYAPPFK